MLIPGHMSQGLMETTIIPLVKKCSKLSDKNNYMPVEIANYLSNVFEVNLMDRSEVYRWTS